jgi:hypothetical protein
METEFQENRSCFRIAVRALRMLFAARLATAARRRFEIKCRQQRVASSLRHANTLDARNPDIASLIRATRYARAGIQKAVMTMIQPWINRPQRHNMGVFLTWACRRRLQEGASHG